MPDPYRQPAPRTKAVRTRRSRWDRISHELQYLTLMAMVMSAIFGLPLVCLAARLLNSSGR